MKINIDLNSIPPKIVMSNPDDFKNFKIVVQSTGHSRVPISVIKDLAGNHARDPDWQNRLARMLEYAQQHGFKDERGIRAHIEHQSL